MDAQIRKGLIQRLSDLIEFRKGICLGQGTAVCGKMLDIPFQPYDSAVLPQQGSITLFCNTAAAGGNHQTGLLSQLCKRFGFPLTEDFLSVFRKNLRNGFPGQFFNQRIGVGEGLSGFGSQKLTNGGFSASNRSCVRSGL